MDAGNAIGIGTIWIRTLVAPVSQAGDGIFLYPPEPNWFNEPAPGIRLKAIRDGIQDYEIRSVAQKIRAQALTSSFSQADCRDWTKWSHEPGDLKVSRQNSGSNFSSFLIISHLCTRPIPSVRKSFLNTVSIIAKIPNFISDRSEKT